MLLPSILKLLRPQQWAKNIFVFLPIFFAGQLFNADMLLSCIIAFIAFSLAASSTYCVNDIFDAEVDRLHPEKCNRPIASGQIAVKTTYIVMAVCLAVSLLTVISFTGKAKFTLIALILLYFIINIAYSVKLKQYAIIDVIIVSLGFVIRIFAGGVATGIQLSEWIIIMTFLLTLFLAFAKRRSDVVLYQTTGTLPRKHTNRYNLEFMNQILGIVSTITIVAYIMYTLSSDVVERFQSKYVYLTAIFVLIGVIRYLQITIVDIKSDDPTKILLRDRFIQCCIAGWIVSFLGIIYL
jgi:4-hydroxybenzoate polyprenyltransferase